MTTQSVFDLYQNPPTAEISGFSISGWVRTVRDSKAFGFIEVNDGTSFKNLQIVLTDGQTEHFAEALKITLGSAIRATGTLVPTPGMKQPFELKADAVEVVGLCDPAYPLQKKRHSFEYLRTIAHLRPRTNTYYAVFRIRSLTAQIIHQFFCGARLCVCAYAHHHRQRLRGRGRDVPGHGAGYRQPPAYRAGRG